MPAPIFKGAKFSISTTNVSTDLLQAGFEALTWSLTNQMVSTPSFMVNTNMVGLEFVDTTVVQNQPGFMTVDGGEGVFGIDLTNAGQLALKAAAESRLPYAFRLELNNKITGGGNNSFVYSWGYVGGGGIGGGGGEDGVNTTFQFALNQIPIMTVPT